MEPDRSWELTRWGRIDQARRELAAVLGKDVSVEKLAELIGLAGPSLWGWKQGSRPKEASIEALEKILVGAGLTRFTRHYIDYGPESGVAEARYRDGLQQAAAAAVLEEESEATGPIRVTPVRKKTKPAPKGAPAVSARKSGGSK